MKRILLFPTRLNERLTDHNSLILKLILMILVIITGLYTRDYRGDYQETVNNNAGDIFYVLFGSLFISLLFPSVEKIPTACISFALACLIEAIQYFQFPFMLQMSKYKIPAYLFGNSFNPHDFIFYAIGAVFSWGVLVLIRKNVQ